MLGLSAPPPRARYHLRTCLYFIIAFLGLLPLFGAALGLVAIESSRRDDAGLDRVARGTILLERVNGLVYAVVMESRGIYMSADWKAAEPFAKNLIRQLGELHDAALAWRADAIASQQANIGELAERIDQFVRFRTELVRLGREESTAAARVFGDNDANRTVRTALNESLKALARAYEQEIVPARSRVEADERSLQVILLALAGVGALALCAGLIFVRIALLSPVLRMKTSMLRLARGELDVQVNGQQHAHEIGEMMQAVEVFHANLVERQKLNRETRLLSDLNEWLQSCNCWASFIKWSPSSSADCFPNAPVTSTFMQTLGMCWRAPKRGTAARSCRRCIPMTAGACGEDGHILSAKTRSTSRVRMSILW